MINTSELVRYWHIDDGIKEARIGEVTMVWQDGTVGIGFDGYVASKNDILGNSKPTIAELLEVGDIVHLKYGDKNDACQAYTEKFVEQVFEEWIEFTNAEYGINTKEKYFYCDTDNGVLKWHNFTITAIELHENRVIQRLEEEE